MPRTKSIHQRGQRLSWGCDPPLIPTPCKLRMVSRKPFPSPFECTRERSSFQIYNRKISPSRRLCFSNYGRLSRHQYYRPFRMVDVYDRYTFIGFTARERARSRDFDRVFSSSFSDDDCINSNKRKQDFVFVSSLLNSRSKGFTVS